MQIYRQHHKINNTRHPDALEMANDMNKKNCKFFETIGPYLKTLILKIEKKKTNNSTKL